MRLNILKIFLFLTIFSLSYGIVSAQSYDFSISNNTTIQYTTGDEHVTVKTEYIREVRNSSYYYSTQGEKVFHIPDLPKAKQYELELERQYKRDSLKVTDSNGRSISYSVEELNFGEGIYVKVPNYKQTTYGNPYKIFVEYKTHDLVKKIYNHVVLIAPALHEDTEFQQVDSSSGTRTSFSYDLKVIVDKNISDIVKVFPTKYTTQEGKDTTIYSFSSQERIGNSPYLEFGTSQIYRFELRYKTPKTDTIIPEKYSSMLKALSTNIYELSLPREFEETSQRVKIEGIFPQPSQIYKDIEGNILAKFEVPANKSSEIFITGYIFVEQDTLQNQRAIPDFPLAEYFDLISKDNGLKKYLTHTKYWEVNDSYVQQEANKMLTESKTFLELVKNDYKYINDRLEYDESKANSDNERIGAKAALMGGGSVCMEYADSMIAILRAQGIPARAALGYSNLNTLSKTNEEGSTRHQWVHIWVPGYGWLSVDPTYESNNMLIGQNIEKILWETFYNEELSNIKIYSADRTSSTDFSDYSVKVFAVYEVPNIEELLDYSDIQSVQEKNITAIDTLNTFVKTTALGKSLVILLPILSILLVLVLALSFVTYSIRRLKSRKVS